MIDTIQWLTLSVFMVLYVLQATHLLRQTIPVNADTTEKKNRRIQLVTKVCYGMCMLICITTMLAHRSVLLQYHIANTILFFVAISASTKAWRAGISMAEKKMGLFVEGIALSGIISLLALNWVTH